MSHRSKLTLLVFFFSICTSAALLRHLATSRPGHGKPAEVYAVVLNQLSAFRADDYPRAYRHASSTFQNKFNIERFTNMIRTEYPGIVRSVRVEFGLIEYRERHAFVQVFFVGDQGEVIPCVYTLISEGDSWKIDGAQMLPRWPAGTRLGGLQS